MTSQSVTHKQEGCLIRLLALVVWFYSVAMIVVLLGRWLIGERWLIIGLINNEFPTLLIFSCIVAILSLLIKRWRPFVLSLPPVLMFVWWYSPMFTARPAAAVDSDTFTVLTFNLHAEETVIDPLLTAIRDANADVVALQEMSQAVSERIDADLADIYPHRRLHPHESPYHGRGVLSRYPLVDDRAWPVEFPIPMRLQRVELEISDHKITLYNFHSVPSRPIWGQPPDIKPRAQQLEDLLALAEQDEGSVILAGDFNLDEWSEGYQKITSYYIDAYRAAGWGFGFTSPDWTHEHSREGPAFLSFRGRIDLVFHSRDLRAVDAEVWPTSGGSDHRPVLATLALVNPSD
jgi:vancomycin resistance protein VanJ